MTGPERRRHRRFRVRLSVQFLRGEVEVAGEIFNISCSGCLLVTPVALKPGEQVAVHLPSLGSTMMSFRVVRVRPVGPWFAVATAFEPNLPSEAVLEELATREPASDDEPEHLF
ncbi:PilZ domain-containing protein [Stigmatella sp. ncwal1]|uniref:PilZ domain-containing protein n=1 Tax=Stigmatella ashevillensis TaxID=2995309 RepID=A0ABT5DKR8_9BACT|nr:PilZ domain-containing protein [Stigmatella ashevillena]MDC0713358.1 PilZ domain-containing protein [Stigmatella ashevillena]